MLFRINNNKCMTALTKGSPDVSDSFGYSHCASAQSHFVKAAVHDAKNNPKHLQWNKPCLAVNSYLQARPDLHTELWSTSKLILCNFAPRCLALVKSLLKLLSQMKPSSTIQQRYSFLPQAQWFPLVACCRWLFFDFAECLSSSRTL